jgi:hypothetical protein
LIFSQLIENQVVNYSKKLKKMGKNIVKKSLNNRLTLNKPERLECEYPYVKRTGSKKGANNSGRVECDKDF